MKKILKNNKKTRDYLESLPSVYLVGSWIKTGVWEFKLAGWKKENNNMIPLVYQYDDFNGTVDLYFLRKIDSVTTGSIIMWTMSKDIAELIANAINKEN